MRIAPWTPGGSLWLLAAATAALTLGCNTDDELDGAPAADEPSPPSMFMPTPEPTVELGSPDCDPLDPAVCSFPWPSSQYLVPDDSRATGYQLSFGETTLPKTVVYDRHINPVPFRYLDGYGLGTPIMAMFPGVDAALLPNELAIADSVADGAAAMLLEVTDDGVRRVPFWIDVDQQSPEGEAPAVVMHPAEVLRNDTRYIVAFRDLQTADGEPIPPGEVFALLRDGATDGLDRLAARQARFDEIFALLEGEGVDLATLNLAWDFHTASVDALTGRMVAMRDEAFDIVGPEGPEMTVTGVDRYSPDPENEEGLEYNPFVAVRLNGTFRVPHYMTQDEEHEGVRGWIFNLDEDGQPAQNEWRDANWYVSIPYAALEGTPHGLINHGHGFFGDAKDVADLGWTRPCGHYPPRECGWYHGQLGQHGQFISYAADLTGMSQEDRDVFVFATLTDVSKFTWITERLHQGMLEYLLLARAMEGSFRALPEVAELNLNLTEGEHYYWGISQGAIFGSTFMALSPEVDRGVFGVSGNNYAVMMDRSRNFAPFFAILASAYPSRNDQLLISAVTQLLWDATEGTSYWRHVSAEPIDGDGPDQVLVDVARGDYQVSLLTQELVARTPDIGLKVMANYDDERPVALVEEQPYPYTGSGLTNWHFGNAWPPVGNIPPMEDPENGDPHESARRMDAMNELMTHFYRTGEIIDVCGGGTCPDLSQLPPEDRGGR